MSKSNAIYIQISLYSTGREVSNKDGIKTLKVDDPYAILENIKQTPRYWKKAKYEMLAKLDNFGPFHFFFTLSCADLRWDENFAAILRQKTVLFKTISLRMTKASLVVKVNIFKNGETISNKLRESLEEDVTESKHEFIRGNVLLATRYFNRRVKSFNE